MASFHVLILLISLSSQVFGHHTSCQTPTNCNRNTNNCQSYGCNVNLYICNYMHCGGYQQPPAVAPPPQVVAPPPQVVAPPPQIIAPPPPVVAPPPQIIAPPPPVVAPPPQIIAPPPPVIAPPPQIIAPPPPVVAPPPQNCPCPPYVSSRPCIRNNYCQRPVQQPVQRPVQTYSSYMPQQRPTCQQPRICNSGQVKRPCHSSQNCGRQQQCCYNQCARTTGCSSGQSYRYGRSTQVNHTKIEEVGLVNMSVVIKLYDQKELHEIINEKLLHLKMELSHLINVDVVPNTDHLDCGLSTMNCLSGRLLSCTRNMTEELINDKQEQQARLLSLTACLTQSAVELKERDVQASMLTMKMCIAAQNLEWKAVRSCMTKADEPDVTIDTSVQDLLPAFIVVINEDVMPFSTTTSDMIVKICDSLESRGIHPNSCSHLQE